MFCKRGLCYWMGSVAARLADVRADGTDWRLESLGALGAAAGMLFR